ncbi:Clp protease N-terminal domain-containing protein [Nocardia sp. alder85J]|uniref:Clp protease N-terminal domain-containing protein n=1 Tax=Nocardia sp. alder85J TaxID=2862949 RepID=UPI001CD77326|nr:Clp protease N-terminal domain-containing protein [Nocardia sp. alder85J]MCX4092934.1 hypothetical protein [Nocardia sp. alder85J]
MPFERFTVKARQVVVRAQEAARHLGHNYIGTEHLLLGLLDVPDGTAAEALHRLGYDKEAALAEIAALVEPGTAKPVGHIPFTPRAKKTLDLAVREAAQLHHTHIGTEHLLLALVTEGAGVGAKALAARIEPIGRIRAAVLAESPDLPDTAAAGSWPTGTPAIRDAVATATALAGGAPVGSHHLLEAMLRAENSMAARALRELGIDPDAVAAALDDLDPETTTDANPEEAAGRRMEIRLTGDEVHIVLRDPATVDLARQVTALSDGPIHGNGPVAGLFVPLWRATGEVLQQIRRLLEPEPAEPAANTVTTAVRAALAPRLRR